MALASLNQRLRYVLGDYDEPDRGWTNQYFRFLSKQDAETFLTGARSGGDRGLEPPLEPDGPEQRSWEVAVVMEELAMTAPFERRQVRPLGNAFPPPRRTADKLRS